MRCWHSTANPDQMNRPRLLFQCFELIKAIQKKFGNGEIAIPSTDSDNKKGVEICILHRAGTDMFADIANFLTQTACSMKFDYLNFAKQDVGITRYFNQQEVDNVSVLGKPIPDGLTEQSIAATIDQAREFKGFRMNDSWRNGIPPDQRAAPCQITKSTLRKFHEKEGNDLADEVKAVMDAISNANKGLKTSTSLITMLAKGAAWLSTVGFVGSQLGGSIFCVMLLWSAGFTGVAIAAGGLILGVVAAIAGERSVLKLYA
ncbi:hypothetical protein BU23DRAFT_564750 [Bimuria novae-zelandiae CBS 107.79]|uniref:Uncharacterized protein n=1 Tax=Bimuria novae-zelandiae CBS 107.79 TaxID=1447943 RepID=A0A6A5VSP2_9PLEO|nr:hypothetical protein BU23DRAFT_564750 [Bimuria novae-zelandiae CBS 107.79]